MHPVFAAKACDPEGEYVRRWLPALAKLPVEFIHCPWEAPFALRAAGKVILGDGPGCTYPARILTDLEAARRRSHDAVMSVRRSAEGANHVLPSGHEWLQLRSSSSSNSSSNSSSMDERCGERAVLITRCDFREGTIKTRQTAEAKWDFKKREKGDALSLAMRDSQRQHSEQGVREHGDHAHL